MPLEQEWLNDAIAPRRQADVRLPSPPPQLPAVLLRPGSQRGRDLDAERSPSLARPQPDPFGDCRRRVGFANSSAASGVSASLRFGGLRVDQGRAACSGRSHISLREICSRWSCWLGGRAARRRWRSSCCATTRSVARLPARRFSCRTRAPATMSGRGASGKYRRPPRSCRAGWPARGPHRPMCRALLASLG